VKSAIMPESHAPPDDVARPRLRSVITAVLMIMLAVMIVRDILVRRWSSPTPPASDVTHRSR
jgi:hypothetical protein